MEFRRKSAERILSELQEQSSRYRTLNFLMTDAILDQYYFAELFPKMKDQECDFRIFYESKAHLSYDKVQKLRDAGVLHLQPGIESLSTPILRSIRKGTTALQNIRILKWCREFGINALWNIIYGFPNEPIEEYSRMVALLPSLSHIQPPSLVRLVLDRFSPYQITPKDFGLEITGPPSYYPYVFQKSPRVIREFSNFAYRFEYRYLDNREPEEYIGEMRAVIEEWTRTFQPERITLRYERGPNFVTIIDERLGLPKGRYTLEGVDATIYLMCDDGATPKTIISRIVNQGQDAPSETYIVDVLKELVLARLLYHEDGRYLSLAIPSSRVHPSILTLMG
jgi:ribosomal peptide maturation radical SAM protein 1